MRWLYVSMIALLAGIVLLSFYSQTYIASSAQELDQQLAIIEAHVKAGAWDDSSHNLDAFQRNWQKTQRRWSILIDHKEMDSIDSSLAKTDQYLAARAAPLALGELSALRLWVSHIPEKESLTWLNIL